MSPYRTVYASSDNPPALFSLAPFGGEYPDCPACAGYARGPGHICYGRRSFFGGKPLCPESHAHFHPVCRACGHRWLMATRRDLHDPTDRNQGPNR